MPAASVAMVIAASFSAEDEWNKESGELWVMEQKKCLTVSLSQSMRSRVDGKHEEMVAIDLLAFVFSFSISDHVMIPQRTLSLKCRPIHVHMYEMSKGEFPEFVCSYLILLKLQLE